jgi:predicted MPP superfamily phosphohydrolase
MPFERLYQPTRHLMTRRRFLALALAAAPSISLANAVALEPAWLKVSRIALPGSGSPCRFVHISDLHHRGDIGFTENVLTAIHKEQPEFVCFSGDLTDTSGRVAEALEFIRAIGVPVFGVPGNHDHFSSTSFQSHQRAFAATGGSWLMNRSILTPDKSTEIVGLDGFLPFPLPPLRIGRRIVITHYPMVADALSGGQSTLVLAGHSHGGQVRLPFIGPLYLPEGVGPYDRGLFTTRSGPLYVSAGLGTSVFPVRFDCRPEITVI